MVRVAKCTGLPIGATMLVGLPVILSNPRMVSSVPPLGGTGGEAEASLLVSVAGATGAGEAGAGAAGFGGTDLAVMPWASAAPSGTSSSAHQDRLRFTPLLMGRHLDPARGPDLAEPGILAAAAYLRCFRRWRSGPPVPSHRSSLAHSRNRN